MRNKLLTFVLACVPLISACGGGSEGTGAQQQGTAPGAAESSAGGAAVPATPPASPAMPMDVPSGTELLLTLETPVSSETAKVEQPVRATVSKPVVVAGMTVIPEGAKVSGTVVAAARSGRVKGGASIAIQFNEVTVDNTPYKISTERIAGTAAVLATRGKEVSIPAGATLQTTIQETVRIMAPM